MGTPDTSVDNAPPGQSSLDLGPVLVGHPSDEFYTPRWLFDVLELTFDLDVAAPIGGAPWVPADRYYTPNDDGLAQPWAGRVWMNPPYSRPGPWMERFMTHGHGIALVPTSKARWFDDLWASDAALVALPSTMKFANGADAEASISYSTRLAALGDDCRAAIARVGRVR